MGSIPQNQPRKQTPRQIRNDEILKMHNDFKALHPSPFWTKPEPPKPTKRAKLKKALLKIYSILVKVWNNLPIFTKEN